MHDETIRRVAMLRHAGGLLRAIAGDSPRIAAMVAREIGTAMQRAAVNIEARCCASDVERIEVDRAVTVVSGGDA